MKTLRFINSGAADGATNMAIDEALALSLARSRDFAYIRFYQWQPPTLSFGYNQNIAELIDAETARQLGLGLVRRMSGGKMVYHADELTFSVGISMEHLAEFCGKSSTYLDRFKFMCNPLVKALCSINVPARFAASREMKQTSSNRIHCYASAAGHSIYAGDRKLIGAAGVIKENCLVVHGSIPIRLISIPFEIFRKGCQPFSGISIACLSEFLDSAEISFVPEITARHFAGDLGLLIAKDSLTAEEDFESIRLAQNKYGRLDWKNAC